MKNLANYLDFDDEMNESSLSERCKNAGHIGQKDFMKANRKAAREEEIAAHGKQISMAGPKTHKSGKEYRRHEKHKQDWR